MRPRRRLDRELVDRGLARDEAEALDLIAAGRVLVEGAPALAATRLVDGASSLHVLAEPRPYVSRGGTKLAGALDHLAITVDGRRCLDAGAGHGGFTDCLLQRGAAEVVAVDVGYGDFDWSLRQDARVRLVERANIRTVEVERLGPPFDLVVADLSFISLAAVVPRLVQMTAPDGDLLLLVKPQFEAPRVDVSPGGIVRDPGVWSSAVESVAGALFAVGVGTAGVVASRLPGTEGNQEFFLHARRGAPAPDAAAVGAAVGTSAEVGAVMP